MEISVPGLVLINGLPGEGKSHCIKYIMYENRKKFDWGNVFSHTTFSAKNFESRKFSEEAVVNLKQMHEELIIAGKLSVYNLWRLS